MNWFSLQVSTFLPHWTWPKVHVCAVVREPESSSRSHAWDVVRDFLSCMIPQSPIPLMGHTTVHTRGKVQVFSLMDFFLLCMLPSHIMREFLTHRPGCVYHIRWRLHAVDNQKCWMVSDIQNASLFKEGNKSHDVHLFCNEKVRFVAWLPQAC